MSGTLILNFPAGSGGAAVTLASRAPPAARGPAAVLVPAGATSVSFPVSTHPVAATVAVPVGAAVGGVSRSAVLTVLPAPAPPATFSVSVLPGEVTGGNAALRAIALAAPAPAGGRVFTLTTDYADLVTLPIQVVVPAGASAVTFPVQTRAVTEPTPVSMAAKTGGEAESTVLTLLP